MLNLCRRLPKGALNREDARYPKKLHVLGKPRVKKQRLRHQHSTHLTFVTLYVRKTGDISNVCVKKLVKTGEMLYMYHVLKGIFEESA